MAEPFELVSRLEIDGPNHRTLKRLGRDGPFFNYDPPDGTAVTPANFNSIVPSADPGTIFILGDGTYTHSNVTPKSGWQFWAQNLGGAIWDGADTRQYAMQYFGTPGTDVTGVEFHGLEIMNYVPTTTGHAPIGGDVDAVGWVFEDLVCHDNKRAGLKFGPGSTVRRVVSHTNGENGIASGRPEGSLVENCEMYGNGWDFAEDAWKTGTGSTGGMKILRPGTNPTEPGFIVRNCSSHNNEGPGYWIDFCNTLGTEADPILFEDLTAVDNDGPGFFLEASRPGPIMVRRCTVSGTEDWHSIYVSGAMICTVEDCTITGLGLMVSEDNLTDRACTEAYVLNNTFINPTPGSMGAQSQSGRDIFDSDLIQFRDNDYTGLSQSTNAFKWDGLTINWAAWQAVGQDLGGTCG